MTRNSNQEIDSLLADLWQRHLPTLHERLNILDGAAAAADSGILDESLRLEARSIAHKLSGNLGMFGFQQAGNIASEIEHLLTAPTPEDLARFSNLTREIRALLATNI